ncbi:MAG: 3-oxoacyl-(acyl-carrier-protein) synthase [Cyanobacteria bacterium RYN_339]|nr:3-oxoacyl-(acyl-carrier-protein) synthase [Cyanobacteria bacterium RYN_339]
MRGEYGVGIVGVGHSLPAGVETNEDLCKRLPELTPALILERSGIQRRYKAGEGDTAAGLAVAAARRAIERAGIAPEDIGLIIACTFSADYVFPPVSAKIQQELGATHAQIFDLQANCAGFVTGLTCASDRMRVDPTVKYALVVGVELHTRYVAPDDATTGMCFSDGAGAAVLGQVPAGAGILDSHFFTDGALYEAVRLRGGGHTIELNGQATWQQAVTHLPNTVRRACEKAGVTPGDVDLFLFHQANVSLIYYVVRKLGQPLEKTHTNVEEIGNTGAASVAIVLSEAVAQGKLKPGQTLVLGAVGAGFNFGASVWKWSAP